jgi:hypothetical protein
MKYVNKLNILSTDVAVPYVTFNQSARSDSQSIRSLQHTAQ